jgi:protein prenyltransferase alpha subunit repeat containing protein 1
MSRALDPSAAAALSARNSQEVYHSIVAALQPSTTQLLEIEILGKSHPLPPNCHVLVEGNSIAITKTKLVQAFIVARQLFFTCSKDFKNANAQDVRDATAVMLLMDPEHLTAANARKRVLQHVLTGEGGVGEVEGALRQELWVVDGLLTSRLHRHTKSPTLWGHRRWVLEVMKKRGFEHDVGRDVMAVVFVAAERHPRNYYAWLHARWLVRTFGNEEVAWSLLDVVKEWCLKHPGDTSGWSFLLFCLFSQGISNADRTGKNSEVCKEVLDLAVSFRWMNEAVWVFLRTLAASGEVDVEGRASFFRTIDASVAAQLEDSKAGSVLSATKEWCSEYSV